jgi:hypothetical protein
MAMNMFGGKTGNRFPDFGTAGQTKKELEEMSKDEFEKFLTEKDPTGRNPHEPGAKLDSGKSPLFQGLLDYFPRACEAVANVSAFGASKYAWKGWEAVPDGVNRYENAMVRHITKEAVEGSYDSDSGLLHKAHRAWNALASLELYIRELDNNDSE